MGRPVLCYQEEVRLPDCLSCAAQSALAVAATTLTLAAAALAFAAAALALAATTLAVAAHAAAAVTADSTLPVAYHGLLPPGRAAARRWCVARSQSARQRRHGQWDRLRCG